MDTIDETKGYNIINNQQKIDFNTKKIYSKKKMFNSFIDFGISFYLYKLCIKLFNYYG